LEHAGAEPVKRHPPSYDRTVTAARRHHRALSAAAFTLLVVAAEIAGRWATAHVDAILHVTDPIAPSARYTPFVLLAVKAGAALLAARLAWRFARAHTTARAGRRVLAALGRDPRPAPRVRLRLSPRHWAAAFGATAAIYLVQADFEHPAFTFAPWLHTYSLPVFAVFAVVVAAAWGVVAGWLADYESYAEETISAARRLAVVFAAPGPARPERRTRAPRRLHGIAFESRPPPLPA
jgi:hypothetical protein